MRGTLLLSLNTGIAGGSPHPLQYFMGARDLNPSLDTVTVSAVSPEPFSQHKKCFCLKFRGF